MSKCISVAASAMAVAILMGASALLAGAQTAVTTYHYDNYRTGWNPNETTLTPANVKKPGFGRLETVALDDQVDGQPLVVPGVMITMWCMWRPRAIRCTRSTRTAERCC
jgi:hypothetical protein